MAETVTQHRIGSMVRVSDEKDPHHGREGEVEERMILRPENNKYPPVLVRFDRYQSRWYHDRELEAVDGEEG